MIWYLLYPFRGTTEAPVLAPNHPLRSAFARYGRYAARHVVTTLLISVSVASLLVYPFPFLYTTDFSNGASNLPHHVWTEAQPLEEKSGVEPDVIMRTVWVHGNYMEALSREVLLGALELQDELLGPTENFNPRQAPNATPMPHGPAFELSTEQRDAYHVVNGLTEESWFFHSPLQYWSCSADQVIADEDILTTVNERKTQSTSVNVTLRHSIVFSGKRFEDRRLLAADALVITLIHMRDSPVGRIWQAKTQALANKLSDKWDVYGQQSANVPSQLYEFQFLPMSYQDTLALGIAYSLTLVYFIISLSKLRAVKSKVGLVTTVMVQLIVSVISSFTICALLKIDLSKIPRFAYPVVIFSMSLENIFRLINAVILTSSDDNTSNRIGHAFGETSHVALASVAQNLLILWGLSNIVSPGVSAFCTFAAIAIIFDFFYLSTFFLSVLSVDVRRTELGDALAKASIRNQKGAAEPLGRQSWVDAMLQGKIAMSTRIAGTTVMVGFVLIAQWHFFENESVLRTLGRIFYISRKYKPFGSYRSSLLVDIHQARSPKSWLRLQDHETAQEVIHVVKPDAHSYIARVFEPLVFVLKGADRKQDMKERLFLPAVYDFARHQSTPFIVTVLVVAAAIRLLMNYLLWDELGETSMADNQEEEPLLAVKTLGSGHSLDVAMLSASSDGHIVSVGLDRQVRVWDVKTGGKSYVLPDNDGVDITFPILAICINDDSHWLALLTIDTVMLWNLLDERWGPSVRVDRAKHKPEGFFFTVAESQDSQIVLIVRRDGTMTEVRPEKQESRSYVISDESVVVSVGSLLIITAKTVTAVTKVMTSSREGQVYCLSQDPTGWNSYPVNIPRPQEREFMSIVALPELGFLLVVRTNSVDLVDAHDYLTLHSFRTDPIQPKSLKCFHSKRRQMNCGSVGLKFLTFAYLNAFTRDLVVQTYRPQHDGESICFRVPGQPVSKTCCRWPQTKEARRVIQDPGVWEALPTGFIIGTRKKTNPTPQRQSVQPQPIPTGLRRRRLSHSSDSSANSQQNRDDWEVWMLSQLGRVETWETTSLCPDVEEDEHLFATNLGPMVRVGRGSVAVGLSNVIKVLIIGHERFDVGADGSLLENGLRAVASRRRNRPSTVRINRPSISTL
ncbi:sterol-sensing domain of SREBP cleavage-activation-domain-containing protein [Pseudomassariella vexata]|uniref:Sterol regulatory element-binding protein cleavage-activating protein n=1 Tax=Pseudomassariella vexata TaxID=1141098 RepID=A0A1Y2EJX8_9PEZI|nr:sterol-sensing domain of SREBP cleavage-activation-domain-containing protein [Pseudomassariella vexata]ORY71849.1 sterol-sensing domain of SREBP cleavage-activation-domain-containing protein [Pseudomassariella vexata]